MVIGSGPKLGFDYVIVGAGSAGCIVASLLSENQDCQVLLLEAGGWDSNFWMRLPVGYYRLFSNSEVMVQFPLQPDVATDERVLSWPRGRTVGGSGSVNGLVYVRGQPQDYDDWERLGATGWNHGSLQTHFGALEDPERGIAVSDLRFRNSAVDDWLNSAEAIGLPRQSNMTEVAGAGVGAYQLNVGARWRSSSARAFLHPARHRKNLTVLTGARVRKIVLEGRRATGVHFSVRGQSREVIAAREVILCAGAIETPQLLQVSGLGPAQVLKAAGVALVQEMPGVGRNLQDHLQVRLISKLKRQTSLNAKVRNPVSLARMGWDWLTKGTGPLTVGAIQVGGAASSSRAEGSRPDLQLYAMPLSIERAGEPLHGFSGFTAGVWQCRPQSRGEILIHSENVDDKPTIRPGYLGTQADLDTLVEGLELLREIQSNSPFSRNVDAEYLPGAGVASRGEMIDYIRRTASTIYHCCGSCRMGTDDQAVVDPQLRVHGIDGLRVIDASVMPQIVSANTNAATMMIAMKGAEMIRKGG